MKLTIEATPRELAELVKRLQDPASTTEAQASDATAQYTGHKLPYG